MVSTPNQTDHLQVLSGLEVNESHSLLCGHCQIVQVRQPICKWTYAAVCISHLQIHSRRLFLWLLLQLALILKPEGKRDFCSNYCHWETGQQLNTEHFVMPVIKQIHFAHLKSNKVNITSLFDYVLEFLSDFSAIFSIFSAQIVALLSFSSCWRLMGNVIIFYWLECKNHSPKTFIWVTDSNSYLPSDSRR